MAGHVHSHEAPARQPVAFSFEGVRYRIVTAAGQERLVLQGVSGMNAAPSARRRLLGSGGGLSADAGTAMMSIMGPSGAGAAALHCLEPPAPACCACACLHRLEPPAPACCACAWLHCRPRDRAMAPRQSPGRVGSVCVCAPTPSASLVTTRGCTCREEQPAGYHLWSQVWRGCRGAPASGWRGHGASSSAHDGRIRPPGPHAPSACVFMHAPCSSHRRAVSIYCLCFHPG